MSAVLGAGLTVVEPKLEDLFTVFGRKLKIDFNCVKIGTIQSIDYATMTASIQIVFQKQMRDGSYQKIPVLTDCPVFTPQGGGFSLQFPIAVGDTALVLFADRNIDNWFVSGGVMPPANGRLHALSDAIAIVGLNAAAKPLLPAPTALGAVLTDKTGATQLGLVSGKITLKNASGSLLAALNNLLTAQETAFAALGADPGLQPSTQTACLAAATATTTAIAALAALLNP